MSHQCHSYKKARLGVGTKKLGSISTNKLLLKSRFSIAAEDGAEKVAATSDVSLFPG